MSHIEQLANVKFCQKLCKSPSEMLQMMKQVYGDDALSRSAMFQWHLRFSQGRESLEDDELTGRPQTIGTERKIEEVTILVRANCSQFVDDLAAAVGMSHGTFHKILSEFCKCTPSYAAAGKIFGFCFSPTHQAAVHEFNDSITYFISFLPFLLTS